MSILYIVCMLYIYIHFCYLHKYIYIYRRTNLYSKKMIAQSSKTFIHGPVLIISHQRATYMLYIYILPKYTNIYINERRSGYFFCLLYRDKVNNRWAIFVHLAQRYVTEFRIDIYIYIYIQGCPEKNVRSEIY